MFLPASWRPGVVATATFAILAAACADTPTAIVPVDEPEFGVVAKLHRVLASVVDASGKPVVGHIVTAVNVHTGAYQLARTSTKGVAVLELQNGSYLVHARNLTDPGPPVPRRLALAPLPDGTGLLNTAPTEGLDNVGVLYDPTAPFTSVPLTPDAYSRLTVSPPLVLSGTPAVQTIGLRYAAGATVTCTLLDSNGSPASLARAENVFLVLPHGSGPLPPLPPDLAGLRLPRGILLGAATVPAGSGGCSLAGIPDSNGAPVVLETNNVRIGGEDKVFVQSFGSSGAGVIDASIVAEPRRARIGYVTEAFDDVSSGPDLGLVTHGWTATGEPPVPTDIFAVAARFRRGGTYTLEMKFGDPTTGKHVTLTIKAFCWTTGCSLTSVRPAAWAPRVKVTSVLTSGKPPLEGQVLWEVEIPGVRIVELRLIAGDDRAPDSGYAPSIREGTGNTWIIAGD